MKPVHVAVIMDGNGRWALKKNLPRYDGHWKGAEVAEDIIEWCNDREIKYLTLFSFSTENWKRPQAEINMIFHILAKYLSDRLNKVIEKNARLHFIGDLDALNPETRLICLNSEQSTSKCTGMVINLAVNYSGRSEILKAAQEWNGKDEFESHLYTAGQPDPDFLIRTGGEKRISNFMLWQMAYTELYFTDVLWPDFSESDLDLALEDFSKRERRFGGIG
ncbi:polyprenyl diphosphate synthase [Athalassotoga sp.]|uniref:polyprenyl diphosphate synthase n=1 Tax=Athalassotoga sp. TaxID=2022597 RepID=UPI003CFC0A38